jgi:hypothetical protein
MALQFSVLVRNAELDAIEATIGTDAVLKIYDLTAGAPADCSAAIVGTVLATVTLPTDWMNAAATGAKTLKGTWADNSADNPGTADFFRLFASDGTTCGAQGTVTVTGGGGDMTVDNAVFAAGQVFTVTTFTLTAGNA